LPIKYPIQVITRILADIESRPLWDKTIKSSQINIKYTKNLQTYSYEYEHVPSKIFEFAEKSVIFHKNNIIYFYISSVNNTFQMPGVKYGTTLISVAKITKNPDSIILNIIKQQKIPLVTEREEYVFSRGYLAFKNALVQQIENLIL